MTESAFSDNKTLRNLCFSTLVSSGVLASEIILTRIFSVLFWYHFGFLVLSTALLGLGIGGFLVRYNIDTLKAWPPRMVLGLGAVAGGVALVLSLLIITHNPFHVTDPKTSPNTIALSMGLELLTTAFVLIVPFALMGAVSLFMLQSEKDHTGKIYAAQLGGSALGCLVAVFLLNVYGGIGSFVIVASILALSGILVSFPETKKTAVLCAVVGVLIPFTLLFQDTLFPMKSPLGKPQATVEESWKMMTDWTSLSRIDVYREKDWQINDFGLWGLSPENKHRLPERLGVLIDYWAYTTILKHSTEPGYYDFLENLPTCGMFSVATPNPSMMIIGPGGGLDIRAGLQFGASHIDAVEINPSVFKVMTRDLSEYSGNLYSDPMVSVEEGDGRSVLSSSKKTYDIIQMSAVDTSSASPAGAFDLTENYLYTVEAFKTYLNHLNPQGLLNLTSWYIPSATGYPRFSLRLFTLTYSALKDQGVANPENHMFFFESKRFAVLLVKKSPFAPEDISRLSRLCDEKRYACLFRPDKVIFSSRIFYSFVKAPDKKAWISDYPFNMKPPTDNSPFYFENRKFDTLLNPGDFIKGYTLFDGQTILIYLFIELVLVAAAFAIGALRLESSKRDIKGWLYFFLIGMGFMLAEMAFIQPLVLFLGHPVYALTVVLFSLLLFASLGSYAADKLSMRIPQPFLLLALALVFAMLAFFVMPVIRSLCAIPSLFLKIALSVMLIAPASFLMGTAFPEGLRSLVSNNKTESFGVYWAFNGLASVFGAALAVIIAIEHGFSGVMFLSCLCYAFAALSFPNPSKAG